MAIRIRRSETTGVVPNPAALQVGELAVNTADAKLWTKHSNGSLVDLNPSGGGGGGFSLTNIDGGNASSSYNTSGIIDGGNSGS